MTPEMESRFASALERIARAQERIVDAQERIASAQERIASAHEENVKIVKEDIELSKQEHSLKVDEYNKQTEKFEEVLRNIGFYDPKPEPSDEPVATGPHPNDAVCMCLHPSENHLQGDGPCIVAKCRCEKFDLLHHDGPPAGVVGEAKDLDKLLEASLSRDDIVALAGGADRGDL